MESFHGKCEELRQRAPGEEQTQPVSFAIRNSWIDTLKADKAHYKEYCAESNVGASLLCCFTCLTWCAFHLLVALEQVWLTLLQWWPDD